MSAREDLSIEPAIRLRALFMAEGVLSCSKKSAPLWRSDDRKSCTLLCSRPEREKRKGTAVARAKQICMIIGRLCIAAKGCAPSTHPPTGECMCVISVSLRRHTCTPTLHPPPLSLMFDAGAPLSARFNPRLISLCLIHTRSHLFYWELIFKIPRDLPTTNKTTIIYYDDGSLCWWGT
jgi:hypothetical protein